MKTVKVCTLFAVVSALWLAPAQGQCPQGWNVNYGWRIKQGKTNVDVDLRQNGTAITGTARYFGVIKAGVNGAFGESGTIRGAVDGELRGDLLILRIHWSNNNTTGVYNGTIRPTGRIEGTVSDKSQPGWTGTWHSDTTMPCAPAPAIATPPPMPRVYPKINPRPNPSATPRLFKAK